MTKPSSALQSLLLLYSGVVAPAVFELTIAYVPSVIVGISCVLSCMLGVLWANSAAPLLNRYIFKRPTGFETRFRDSLSATLFVFVPGDVN